MKKVLSLHLVVLNIKTREDLVKLRCYHIKEEYFMLGGMLIKTFTVFILKQFGVVVQSKALELDRLGLHPGSGIY
jgi:hypothetical protein